MRISTGFALASWILSSVPAAVRGGEGPPRPNIILILADDLGFSDIGCYGSEISTPNLDGLAADGLRFTQFYNTARCCPTRASLLTGLYPHQAGVGHMVEGLQAPGYEGYLNDRSVTIAEALRPAGYRTLMVGKWHVGETRPHWPVDRGFERYYGLISGASSYFGIDKGRTMAVDGEPYVPPDNAFYITDAFSDWAVKFIDEYGRGKEPFFLYVAYTAPHWPLHAPPEDIAKYRGKYLEGWDALRERRRKRQIELGIVDPRWPLTPRDAAAPAWADAREKETWDLRMSVYAAQVDRMDRGIGRILGKIEELGVRENTLVLFLADNGGCAEQIDRGEDGAPIGSPGSYTSYRLPWANASNTPFRLYKHWVHEGGIATPLIVRWPARIRRGGEITHQPGHLIDIMATLIDVAGAEYPRKREGKDVTPLEGLSLLPAFDGKERSGHEALFWEHEGNRAVRKGKWKLVSRYPREWELYDLEADRCELRNLAAEKRDIVAELSALYARWAKRCGVLPWEEVRAARRKEPARRERRQ